MTLAGQALKFIYDPSKTPVGGESIPVTIEGADGNPLVSAAERNWLNAAAGTTLDYSAYVNTPIVNRLKVPNDTTTSVELYVEPTDLTNRSRIVAIDPFTTNCEVRRIATISGTTINLDGQALETVHPANTLVLFLDSFVLPAELFGASPGGGDSATAINNGLRQLALSQAGSGGTILLQPDTYSIASSIHPPVMGTGVALNLRLEGNGYKTVIKWTGTFDDDAKILDWDKDVYNNGNGFAGHQIRNLVLDGNQTALWGLYSNGLRGQCVVENVRIQQCVGSIYADDCWYSRWKNISVIGQVDGLPTGFTSPTDADRWATVHNVDIGGPVFFRDANTVTIDGLTVSNGGVSNANIPATKARTYQACYIEGIGVNILGLSFENTNGHPTTGAGDGVDRLLAVGGHGVHFGPIYVESCHADRLVEVEPAFDPLGGLTFDAWYIASSEILEEWFYLNKGVDLEVGFIYAGQNSTFATKGIFRTIQEASIKLGQVEIHEGPETTIGNVYTDNTTIGREGPWVVGTNVELEGPNTVTKVVSGLTVTDGSDATSSYILVEAGVIETNGKRMRVGFHGDGNDLGWLFRLANSDNYYVVVDQWGCVFVERAASARETLKEGKAILSRVEVDGAGAITLRTDWQDNTVNGRYTNYWQNIEIWAAQDPATASSNGNYAVGDLCWYTAPAAAGKIGAVCTSAGRPGTWKEFGAIDA